MQAHTGAHKKLTPKSNVLINHVTLRYSGLFQMAIANEEMNKVNQGQGLSSPRMLKEYKYKRSTENSLLNACLIDYSQVSVLQVLSNKPNNKLTKTVFFP